MGLNKNKQNKQAMILTAYNDFDILAKLLKCYSKKFDCYVHVDKKSEIPEKFLEDIFLLSNVFIYQRYRVNWGGYGHVSAVLYLLKKAKKKNYDYYHILSGNTFPCQKLDRIFDFFTEDKIYIEMFETAGNTECKRREQYFYFTDLFASLSNVH